MSWRRSNKERLGEPVGTIRHSKTRGELYRRAETPEACSLWPWVVGAFILLAGLFIIAGHPYWRAAEAIIVPLARTAPRLTGDCFEFDDDGTS